MDNLAHTLGVLKFWVTPINLRLMGGIRLSRGFTLTELLVVVAVIGLLLGILLPALASARREGKRTACAAAMKQSVVVTMTYATMWRDAVPHIKAKPLTSRPASLGDVRGRVVDSAGVWFETAYYNQASSWLKPAWLSVGPDFAGLDCPSVPQDPSLPLFVLGGREVPRMTFWMARGFLADSRVFVAGGAALPEAWQPQAQPLPRVRFPSAKTLLVESRAWHERRGQQAIDEVGAQVTVGFVDGSIRRVEAAPRAVLAIEAVANPVAWLDTVGGVGGRDEH